MKQMDSTGLKAEVEERRSNEGVMVECKQKDIVGG